LVHLNATAYFIWIIYVFGKLELNPLTSSVE
jgi:hypothetical protein